MEVEKTFHIHQINSMTENLYDTLGVGRQADTQEIKKAYKKLAMKYHPDRGGDQEQFKKISEAYTILSDQDKRKRYDQFGTVDMSNMEMPDMHDIFNSFFGFGMPGMGGMPGMHMPGMGGMHGMGGMGRGAPPSTRKAPGRHMQLEVTLEEVMKGSTVPFRIHRKKYHGSKTCTGCNGQGQRIQQMSLGIGIMTQSVVECTSCQGSGSLYSEKDITTSEEIIQVPVPQGIPMGNKLVIRGKADEYPGRDTGDVVLSVVYKKHAFYRPSTKNPLDLEASIPLSLSEFLLGFEKHVLLLDQTTLAIHQPTHTPLRRILSGPVEKVIPKHGFSYKGHTGSLVLRFEVHFPDPLPLEALSAFPALTTTTTTTTNHPFLSSNRGGTADHPTVHLDRC